MSIFDKIFKGKQQEKKSLEQSPIGKILTDSAMDALKEKTATSTDPLKPGEVVVILTGATSVGLGMGKFFDSMMDAGNSNTVSLDILALFDPRTGQTMLYADDPEGKHRSLEAIINDKNKSYVLRIEKDNLDFLKQNTAIWKQIKKVVE